MSIKFWILHNRSRIVTALVFCLVFTLLAFAPPLSTSAHAIALVDDSLMLILTALLGSVGITLVGSDSLTVTDWLSQRIQAHAAYAGYVWEEVKSGFEVGVNKLGDILANNNLLSWFSDFAEWLKDDNNLSDNTSVPIIQPTSGYTFSDGTPLVIPTFNSAPYDDLQNSASAFLPNVTYTLSNGTTILFTQVADGNRYQRALIVNGVTYSPGSQSKPAVQYYLFFYKPFNEFWLSFQFLNAETNTVNYSPVYVTSPYIYPDTLESFLGAPSGSADYVTADVGTMDIPVDGTNYTDEDGTLVTGVGSWGDSLYDILEKIRAWLDAQSPADVLQPDLEIATEAEIVDQIDTDLLSVDNWPGMLPPAAFPEFSFSSIWHYVTDWLAAFSGTLSAVLGISFALPAVSIVYAVIVLSLTLWLLRKVSS